MLSERPNIGNFINWSHAFKMLFVKPCCSFPIAKTNWQLPFVLAMGNEQKGLSNNILNACDQLIKLPMLGRSDSLNLGVSTGIMLYESIRKNPK